jgi:transcription initiation factor IIE alpha subunit
MLLPLETVEKQVSKTDQQLMLHLILEQKETNRLLNLLLGQSVVTEVVSIDELKRPDIMKRVSELPDKPSGWQKWGTEEMRKLLKEAV